MLRTASCQEAVRSRQLPSTDAQMDCSLLPSTLPSGLLLNILSSNSFCLTVIFLETENGDFLSPSSYLLLGFLNIKKKAPGCWLYSEEG